uniref:Seminal fluid protein HACP016 n=1 Tax=Parastrongyloides trichosuri TaxID=131310 RepID=A0A0N4ZC74_PARTI
MKIKYLFVLCIAIVIDKISCQGVLFPHGYFDMKKLGTIDAFYLNMLALSNLEYGGTTIEELEELSKTRFPEETKDDHVYTHKFLEQESSNIDNDNEKVKNPFLRSRKLKIKRAALDEEKDTEEKSSLEKENTIEVDDPFSDIVTRAPKRPWYKYKVRNLNRDGIMTRNKYNQLKSYYKRITTTTLKPLIDRRLYQKMEEYHRPFIIALPIPPSIEKET